MFFALIPQIFNKFSFQFNLRLSWSVKVICLIFSQGNQAGDGRGAQYSYAESSYPQSSFVSSTSSKTSFRPSSSSASGGVFGSSARNDRTSALKAAFQVFVMNFFLLLPITFFFKYVSLEICNIQLHNCHIYSRKRIPSASCGQLSLFWLDVTFVMLLHPNESFSWRLIRCWYIQVFHVLVLRPSTSLTFALHLPLRLTHGTLQVITVRLNPLTGHNRQNHKNRPSRNPVGTQLRNIHVHTEISWFSVDFVLHLGSVV